MTDAKAESAAALRASEALVAALRRNVDLFLDELPRVRAKQDPEAVHRARVALRRLRSHVRTFRPLLEPTWARELSATLREVAAPFGPLRDADVLLARFEGELWSLPTEDQLAAERLLDRLRVRGASAHEALETALTGSRYAKLVERVEKAFLEPHLLPDANEAAAKVFPPLVRARWRRARRKFKRLSDPPLDRELHMLRIQIKHCRYASEAAEPICGKRARRFAAELRRLQDLLGEHQDACMAQAWLRANARLPDESFVAGQLFHRQEEAAVRVRETWPAVWRRATRKPLRTWFLT